MEANKRAEKGLITIAIGDKYRKQAEYLALSAILNAPNILRAVITDKPETLSRFYDIIVPYNPSYGDPFTVKTRLNIYTPFEKTLYLDADSLIIHNVDPYLEYIENNDFVYNGIMISEGDWYFNIAEIAKKINVKQLPKFNSGMFLFKNNEITKNIFDIAYDYLIHQKERNLGVDFFRDKMLPDEPFLSIALAQNNIAPVEEYGRFSRTLINAEKIKIDVIKKIAFFIKNGEPVFPLVVHLCGRFGRILFLREKIKLFFYFNNPTNSLSTSIFILIRNIFKKKEKKGEKNV